MIAHLEDKLIVATIRLTLESCLTRQNARELASAIRDSMADVSKLAGELETTSGDVGSYATTAERAAALATMFELVGSGGR